ncbi:MAG: hypothetical protein ACFCVH_11925 [Alphaproteobacteria bacterium]
MSCEHDCALPPAFPAAIANRPGLDRIGYRIGDYATFRAHGLARLDQAWQLAQWTHRGADDPGIALLECGAIAGEILAFYQQLYANEAWLRTAEWRESVARLVALTGYRLAPGLGGEAAFALEVTGDAPVTVPAGFPFKADIEGGEAPALFETIAETTAVPWLSWFSLYAKRKGPAAIAQGDRVLELQAVDGATGLAARQAVEINPGDRILLVPDTAMFEAGGGAFVPQARSEILVVDKVETVLDRIAITFAGSVTVNRGATARAFKIGRSFKHFGHNAPVRIAALNELTGRATFNQTVFHRGTGTAAADYTSFADNELAFDGEVDDLPAGAGMIVTGAAEFASVAGAAEFAVVKQVDAVRKDAVRWAGLAGGSTVTALRENLFTNAALTLQRLDVRRLQAHEVLSPALTLGKAAAWDEGPFGLDSELDYFGTYDQAVALAGRTLLLEDAEGVTQTLRVDSAAEEFDLAGRDATDPWMWRIRLDQPPRFDREAFAETGNTVTVYGNVVLADQGETQAEAIIGNGDARAIFQTFPLPKAPLTWLLHAAATPPHTPELEVFVDGVLWSRVDTFFHSGPKDRVYVVREDDEGVSQIQFGDGVTGARLPSGRRNVKARFRVGSGARGPLKEGQSPKPMGRLKPLSAAFMPAPAVNGAEPETADGARQAAPARMQALGRLVGLADYEAEALALPGVRKARAAWVAPTGSPRLQLVVMTDGGSDAEAAAVAAAMTAANRCRGPNRFPIETVNGFRQYLHLDLTVGYEPERLPEDLEPAIRLVLGVEAGQDEPEDGLFGFGGRQFGQGAHVSQVIGIVQQVEGVVWVRVDAFQAIDLGVPPETDPTRLAVPAVALRQTAIGCPVTSLLALHDGHLALSLAKVVTAQECPA